MNIAIAAIALLLSIPGPSRAKDSTPQADFILVEKAKRTLTLFKGNSEIARFPITLGTQADGPKTREGDKATPEGTYSIDSRKQDSSFHLALHISYPNAADRERAKKLGVPPGGDIMIHGTRDIPRWPLWARRISDRVQIWRWNRIGTLGCIGLHSDDMDALWERVPVGTKIEIRP